MGIVNVTPDSFSASTRVAEPAEAVRRCAELVEGGAGIVDVGGESTRPGSTPVAASEEQLRVIPVIEALVSAFPDLPLSVDTVHAATAEAALDAGAAVVNDVTAGRHEPGLLRVASHRGAGLVLAHSRGEPGALADLPASEAEQDVAGFVARELDASRRVAFGAGNAATHIVLDPGFGFGKTARQNWRLLDALDSIVGLGQPVLVGVSRKRFLGEATGQPVDLRDAATAAACAIAHDRGARIFRVHQPAAVRDALSVAHATSR
jgi:dihydropteroate synthase